MPVDPTGRPRAWTGRLRSLLFAPATREDFILKLPARGADAVVLDCEDATPAALKEQARALVAGSAAVLVAAGCRVTVRVNGPESPWFADDLALAIVPSVSAVVVPKVERLEHLDRASAMLEASGLTEVGVIAGLETALGVADARILLAHPAVCAGYFGAEDFIADLGGRRTRGNAEVATARSLVALAGRLAGVPVLDQVVADFRDEDRFLEEAESARALGYAGKLCIHPGQVALANRSFVPSTDELERARRLIGAYETASAAGRGAIDFEGQMVDEPLAAQARRVIELADGITP